MSYRHLTLKERYHIQAYKEAGYIQKDIAKEIGVNPSTISRELQKNSSKIYKRYTAVKANQLPVSEWYGYLNNNTIADAILDRIVYSSHRIELEGESMRKINSVAENTSY